jgi:hypothetical protein
MTEELKKYIICKGKFGFADRLRLLTACIEYSKKFKRLLFIEWNDNHNSFDFMSFFDLEQIDFNRNNNEIINLNAKTVYPLSWSSTVEGFKPYVEGFTNSLNLEIDYEHDIIVFDEGWHKWYPDIIVQHFVLNNNLREALNSYISEWGNFIGYHIRLSDQIKTEYRNNIEEASKQYDAHLNEEIEKLELFLELVNSKVFLATDNVAIKMFFKNHPRVLTQGSELEKFLNYQSTHKFMGVHHSNHKECDVDTEKLNLETLVDFFLLTFSDGVVISRGNYSLTAETLRKTSGIESILGKYPALDKELFQLNQKRSINLKYLKRDNIVAASQLIYESADDLKRYSNSFFFHTNEIAPFVIFDLGFQCDINGMAILNRLDLDNCKLRANAVICEVSENMETWKVITLKKSIDLRFLSCKFVSKVRFVKFSTFENVPIHFKKIVVFH